jgi:transcriptional regulator with GAF, ATPase, and Fis domain
MNNAEKIPENLLLKAITTALSRYIAETDPHVLFNGLLDTLLELTASEYGFIGEVFYTKDQTPFIKSYATTNIAWSEETQKLYERAQKKGMIFSREDSLYGAVLKTGKLIISNQPASDSRSCGIPQGHPPLNTFMGIPFFSGDELLGVVGIANKENGYQQSLAKSLAPFLETCGNLIQAYRNNIEKQELEKKLRYYQRQLSNIEDVISLGYGYTFSQSPPALTKNGSPILLTPKEMTLLELLVKNCNQIVHTSTLEEIIWKDIVVSESSLRSLLRRLRKKLPEIEIKTVRGFGFMLNSVT